MKNNKLLFVLIALFVSSCNSTQDLSDSESKPSEELNSSESLEHPSSRCSGSQRRPLSAPYRSGRRRLSPHRMRTSGCHKML